MLFDDEFNLSRDEVGRMYPFRFGDQFYRFRSRCILFQFAEIQLNGKQLFRQLLETGEGNGAIHLDVRWKHPDCIVFRHMHALYRDLQCLVGILLNRNGYRDRVRCQVSPGNGLQLQRAFERFATLADVELGCLDFVDGV